MDIPVKGSIFDFNFLDAATYAGMNSWVQPGATLGLPDGHRWYSTTGSRLVATFFSTPWQETGVHPVSQTIEPVNQIEALFGMPLPTGGQRQQKLMIRLWDVAMRALIWLDTPGQVIPELGSAESILVPLEFVSAGPLTESPGGEAVFTSWRRQSFVLGFLDHRFDLDVSVEWAAP